MTHLTLADLRRHEQMNDHPDETPDMFPMTESQKLMARFAYSPADQAALDRRDAERNAALQATLAIEEALRGAEPPNEDIDDVLAQRNTVHGDFTDDATTAQALKVVMRQGKNWNDMPSYMHEALEQMQTKIARILAGDFNHPDHWRDLQGYPRLVEQRL